MLKLIVNIIRTAVALICTFLAILIGFGGTMLIGMLAALNGCGGLGLSGEEYQSCLEESDNGMFLLAFAVALLIAAVFAALAWLIAPKDATPAQQGEPA